MSADPAVSQEESPQREKGITRGSRARALPPGTWVLYVLRCRDGTLYCGITNQLDRRLAQHNRGKGAKYTKGRGPVVLLRSWHATSRSAALRAERAFKSLTREAKEKKVRSRARADAISRLLRGEEDENAVRG